MKRVLRQPTYLAVFILLTPVIATLLFLIPITTIPGNSVALGLQMLSATKDYLILISIAALESLLLVMFWYAWRRSHTTTQNLKVVGQGNVGMVSGVMAFLFGSKLCPICLATIFGVFGPSATLAALYYRPWILGVSVFLLLVSLYLVAKRINKKCAHCLAKEEVATAT